MVKTTQKQTSCFSWRQWTMQMFFCNAMILCLHFNGKQFSVKMLFCIVMFAAFGAGSANAQTYQKTIGNFDNFFVNPQEVAVHPTTGDVYIAASGEIYVLDSDGDFKFKFGGYGQGNGQFSNIGAMDFDTFGNLYVGTGHTTYGLPAIQIFDADGNFVSTFGITGTGADQISSARDLAVGSDGNIYVLETTKVKIFDTNAVRLLTISDGQVTWGRQLALDSDDNIYVTDLIKKGVIVYSNAGLAIRSFGSSGTGDGQFQNIAGIAIDNNDNIFVSDIGNQRIQVFSIEGTFLRKFASGGLVVSSIANVYAITIDINNSIYTASSANHKIQKFANDGSFVSVFGTGGSLPGQLLNAKDLKIANDGSIYVLESGFWNPRRVHIFESNGDVRSAFNINFRASSFALNSLGEIFITDEDSDIIHVYNSEGTLLRSKSGSGAGTGQLDGPSYIDIDSDGNVYVYESQNYRIQVFDKDFNYIRHFGSQGEGDNQFSNVQTIAVDNDKVYVYDHGTYEVKVYNLLGNFLLKFGSNGNAGGKFYLCSGIDTDPYGNIYTIDYSHNYIQIFSSEGTFLRQYRNTTNGQGVGNARAMALNANGDMHVISFVECRVQVYNHVYPTLTFDNITKDYGDAPFTLSASSSSLGTISFEELNDLNEMVSLSGDEVTIHKGGSTTLRAKLVASAPDLAYYKDAQLTVNKGAATLLSDNASYVYDGTPKSIDATTNPTDITGISIAYYLDGELVSDPTDAGTYTAKINLINTNYEAAEITRTLTITKAPLVFTTLDQSKVYKEPIPELTYTLEGFKNGEDDSVIDVLPTLTTSATINSNVGEYIIGVTGSGDLVDNNYFVSSTVNGQLTITKAPANINLSNLSKTYTGNSMFPDYDTEPVAFGLFWQFAKNGISISGFPTEAGTYDLKAYISNANYEADTAMATFEITKAPLKIRANNKARAYGETTPSTMGNALHFDGENDVVQIVNNGQFSSMANEYTIEAWVNIENPHLNQKIFGSFAFSEGFLFGVVDGKVYFESTDTNNEIKVLQAGTVEANIWAHLALTYKAGDKMEAYVDGTKVGEIDAPYAFKPSSAIIKIGEYLGYKFKGQVDELRVWNIAKSQSQISAERMAVSSVESPNLLAYYNFNSGDARYNNSAFTLLHDHSTNSNDGTLTNFALDGESSNWIDNNIADVDVTYLGFVGGDDESELSALPFVYTNATRFGNVGTYNLVPKGANAANYEITNQVGTLTVNKLPLALVSENASRVYGDTNPEFTGSISGALAKDNLGIFLSTAALADSPAGNSFMIDVDAVDPLHKISNYEVNKTTGSLTIEKAPLTLKINDASRKYKAEDPAFTFELEGFKNGEDQSEINTLPVLVSNAALDAPIGTYTIDSETELEDNNYYQASVEQGSLTVEKALGTIEITDLLTTYSGLTQSASYLIEPLEDFKAEYEQNGVVLTDFPKDAGLYNVKAYYLDPNFEFDTARAIFEIAKAPLTIKVSSESKIYGSVNPEFQYEVSGFQNGEDLDVLDMLPAIHSESVNEFSPVGEYAISLSGGSDNNYAYTLQSSLLNVTPRPIVISTDSFNKIYGDDLPELTGSISNALTEDNLSLEFNTEANRFSAVGSYSIETTVLDPSNKLDNYTVETINGAVVVDKRTATVQIDDASRAYGEENPPFYGRVLNAVPVDHLSLNFSTDALIGSNAGTYTIDATINDPNDKTDNYEITFTTGTLTVEKATPALVFENMVKPLSAADFELEASSNSPASIAYSVIGGDMEAINLVGNHVEVVALGSVVIRATQAEGDNYLATQTEATLVITDLDIPNLTLADTRKAYGDASFSLVASSDSEGLVSYSLEEGSAISVTAEGLVNILSAGSAKVKVQQAATASHVAYSIIANVLIDKAVLTVTANHQNMVYGNELPELTVSYSGFKNTDNQNLLSRQPVASTTASSSSEVGLYPISVTGGESNNYDFNLVEATLTISKASLQVLVSSTNRTYGSSDPAFEITYDGFKNGEDVSVINALPNASTMTTLTSPVGNYAISVCCGADNNYDFTYQAGTLSIEKAALTVQAENQTITYGESLPSLTVSYSGFKNNEQSDVLNRIPVATTTATSESNAGDYSIEASGAESNNYHFNYLSGTLTITKAVQFITSEPVGIKNVNDPDFEIHASSSANLPVAYALISGPASLVGNMVSLTGEVGRVVIKASQPGNLNYLQAEEVEISFDVNTKLTQTITVQAIASQFVGNEVMVEVSSNSQLAVSLEIVGGIAELNAHQLKFTQAGVVTLKATQSGNDEYNAAPPVEIQIDVDYRIATANLVVDQQSTCGDGSYTFTLTTEFAGTAPRVKWYQNEELIIEGLEKTFSIDLVAGELATVSVAVVPSADAQSDPSLETNATPVQVQAHLVTQATIQQTGDVLSANEGVGYQWFLNNQMTTLTTKNIVAETTGSYKVKVNYENGCESESEEINVVVLGLPDGSVVGKVILYPNPANDYVKMSIQNETLQNAWVDLFDQQGRKALTINLKSGNDQIDVSTLRKGVYTLVVNGQTNRYTARFVKQ